MSRKTSEARAYAAACQKARRAGLRFTEDTDPEVLRIYVWRKGAGKLRLHYRGPQDVRRLPVMHDRFECPHTAVWGSVSLFNARTGGVELLTHWMGNTARQTCPLTVWQTLDLTLEAASAESGYRRLLFERKELPQPTQRLDVNAFVTDPRPVSAFRIRREG